MKKSEVLLKVEKFNQALKRLKEAVDTARSQLEKNGTIQRFELTVELLWKTLKNILRYQGVECFSPRDCIKKAFRYRIIDDDEIILDMLEDRNLSFHIYDSKTADEIFERIKKVYLKYLLTLHLEEKV